MASDINITGATVVAIQGEVVSTTTPTDGYVLTWNSSGDGYWEPKPTQASGLRKDYFTSNGFWTCPENVYSALIIGAGGGGGGAGGSYFSLPGGGGGASIQQIQYTSVVPNTTYTINIGSGGSGGTGGTSSVDPTQGVDGEITSMTNGGSNLFYAIGGGRGGIPGSGNNWIPGTPFSSSIIGWVTATAGQFVLPLIPGCGGTGNGVGPQLDGMKNWIGGYNGGSGGTNTGGGGGGAGPQGNGANGSNGSTGGAVSSGSNAASNTGAGGGGGGAGNNTGNNGGNGGTGGSGYLYIIY